jgi:DNA-binding MarR family transcriptional regulator
VAEESNSEGATSDDQLVYKILKVRFAFCKRCQDAKLAPIEMGLIDLVHLGELEGRPYDASSISGATSLSRSTVSRRLRQLERRGLVEQRRTGRNRYYYCTQKARDLYMPLLLPIARLCQSVST